MSTKITKFKHLQGEDAYLIYWLQIYRFKSSLSMIKSLQLNLEIIIDAAGDILAYRFDLPDNMKWMVLNDGHWQIYKEECRSLDVLDKVKEMIVRNFYSCCKN
jgi:hypothetical protein